MRWTRIADRLLGLIYPAEVSCIICDRELNRHIHWVCPECAALLPFVSENTCSLCGKQILSGYACPDCIILGHSFSGGFSVFLYTDVVRNLIFNLKYFNKRYISECLGGFLYDKIPFELWNELDMIIPVPLHDKKKKHRGFNQAELISRQLARLSGCPMYVDLLKRVKETTVQFSNKRANRIENVKNAFVAHESVRAKSILLVDDIITSGSTANSCTLSLLEAGAKKVYIATVACAQVLEL